jgi:dTDP-4-amino-4,6-dideoxygalactose transaminase
VIVPAHTFIASALGVLHAGASPVFCDVEGGTGLIDPAAAASAVTDRTAAILAVHLYGQVCDMDALGDLARAKGLLLLEDAAQAHGARHGDARAGSLGSGAAFSFYPSKNLGALGDGGAIVTGDEQIADRARALRHLGQLRKGHHELTGWNERLDGVQAALLRVKLPHLDEWNDARRRHAARLGDQLAGVRLLEERDATPCIYHLFPVRVPYRDDLAAALGAEGVQTGVHYSPAVPDQPPFAGAADGDFPAARAWAAEQLSLPMFAELTDAEVDAVAAAMRVAAPA